MTPDPQGYPSEAGYIARLREAVAVRPPPHWSFNEALRTKGHPSSAKARLDAAIAALRRFKAANGL